ncbi:MAG: hypothetical protein Q7R41_19870, partial [Phycisphaerales bacterium]|nr:hypothetical protein [Phycisphaerales bacterium]
MKTLKVSSGGFLVAIKMQTFVCVPPLPLVLNSDSGMLTTAVIWTCCCNHSIAYLCEGFPNMLSGS